MLAADDIELEPTPTEATKQHRTGRECLQALEQLEQREQVSRRTAADAELARTKALTDPENLTALDRATLDFFGWGKAARPTASPATERRAPGTMGRRPSSTEALGAVIVQVVKPLMARLQHLEDERHAQAMRIAELEQSQVHDAGVWAAGVAYAKGALVTHHSATWLCNERHVSAGDDLDHTRFRLLVKSPR